jgi:NADPH:quinone reductase-like Zn-dependent oxidoreductase
MRRWILKAGVYDLDGLVQEDVATPEPGPGEVRVKLHAVSLNYRDHLVITSPLWRSELDIVPVADGAGVIDAIGEGVTDWAPGDRVINLYIRDFFAWPPPDNGSMGLGAGTENGLLAEYSILPAQRLVRAPASLSLSEAATIPCAAHTAWTALTKLSQARPNDTALILGTGGVALFALDLCQKLGIRAIVTTSQEDKRQRLLDMGAAAVVNYRSDPKWGETVYSMTGGGVDKVINTAGVGSLNQAMAAAKFGGNVVTVGMITQATELDEYAFLAKGLTLHGMPVGGRDGLYELIAFIDSCGLKPLIHKTFDFDDAKLAYGEQRSKDLFGKVVIELPLR